LFSKIENSLINCDKIKLNFEKNELKCIDDLISSLKETSEKQRETKIFNEIFLRIRNHLFENIRKASKSNFNENLLNFIENIQHIFRNYPSLLDLLSQNQENQFFLQACNYYFTIIVDNLDENQEKFKKILFFLMEYLNPLKYFKNGIYDNSKFNQTFLHLRRKKFFFENDLWDFLMCKTSILALAMIQTKNPNLKEEEIDNPKIRGDLRLIFKHLFEEENIFVAPLPRNAYAITMDYGRIIVSKSLWNEFTTKKSTKTKLKFFNYLCHEIEHLEVKIKIKINFNSQFEYEYEYRRTNDFFRAPGSNYAG